MADKVADKARPRAGSVAEPQTVTQAESSAHWGRFVAEVSGDGPLLDVKPYADDSDAAPAIANVADSNRSRARVAHPSAPLAGARTRARRPVASSGANVLVRVERYDGPLPETRADEPPRLTPLP